MSEVMIKFKLLMACLIAIVFVCCQEFWGSEASSKIGVSNVSTLLQFEVMILFDLGDSFAV